MLEAGTPCVVSLDPWRCHDHDDRPLPVRRIRAGFLLSEHLPARGRPVSKLSLKRADVIQLCLDKGRLSQ